MSEPIKIALSKLVLWYDAARIQTWPAFLSKVPENTRLNSPTEYGRKFHSDRMTDEEHLADEDMVRNLPGLEKRTHTLFLRGLGLLTKENGCYSLSQEARDLASAYRKEPKGHSWVHLLSRLLLLREPRIRALVGLLSEEGAELMFPGSDWFSKPLRKSVIRRNGGDDVYPFQTSDKGYLTLRTTVMERPWWALGEWRQNALLEGAKDCIFVGQLQEKFSLHHIGSALHAACEVLLHAGILKSVGNTCVLDETHAAQILGDAVAEDFGWKRDNQQSASLPMLLKSLLSELRNDTGFVVASELRAALAAQGIENPDKEIASLEKAGSLEVYAEDYGQSRHGAGLYGDPRKQLVKIRLVMGGN